MYSFLVDVTRWIMRLYLPKSQENDEDLNLISLQRVGSLQLFDEPSAWLSFKQRIARIADANEHNRDMGCDAGRAVCTQGHPLTNDKRE
jgi:hypothetical protein